MGINRDSKLTTLVGGLITQKTLSEFTWTGKADKLVFKDLTEIQDVLFRTMLQINTKYTIQQFKHDLVYKVLKYAYRYNKSKESDEAIS